MNQISPADTFERRLNDFSRHPARETDDDLVRFAARLSDIAPADLAAAKRADIWSTIMSSPATTSTTNSRAWRLPRPPAPPWESGRRSSGVAPRGLPAPAVVFFAILIALVVALTGFGHDGSDAVTPTVYAEQAATAIASPAGPIPTSTLTIVDPNPNR